VLTVATLGDGAIARMALEGGAELVTRGLAVRAASAAGVLGRVGRALRAEVAVTRDSLNPVIGSKTFIKVGGRVYDGEPLRLYGDHPVRDALRGAKEGATKAGEALDKAGEAFDQFPLSFQDSVVEALQWALHAIRHVIG
jgi:hypothetical protein